MIPLKISLYLGPAAPLLPNWAIVRVAVKKAGALTGGSLPWTVLRITRDSDAQELAVGMTDRRGEGVLAVPGQGQGANQNGGGAVVATTVDATVTAFFDPGNLQQPDSWLPDPDVVLDDPGAGTLKKTSAAVKLGRGTLSVLSMEINV
jgi:hypothetical protein